ncbi:hypothetical protein ACIBHX_28345 [Nonomuraea sp. NPDC050536]|uniref:hypothetical protein n=1 Tax=Nonomuraea sp. NPDC050536 TaxID=3364366 RepID=UPI0037C6DCF3
MNVDALLIPRTLAAAARDDAGAGQLPVIIGVVAVLVLVVTRMSGKQLRPGRLLILPIVLAVVGLAPVVPQLLAGVELHGIDYQVIAVDLTLSIGLGGVRGFTVQIYAKDATNWYRYGPVTVALWCLSIALRFAVGRYGAGHAATTLATSAGVIFMLGLTLLIQNVIVIARNSSRA